MVECCIFDLDGTLLQTLDTITYHLNNALEGEGLKRIDVTDTAAFIGNGARKLVKRAVNVSGDVPEAVYERVLNTYNEAYNADPLPLTYPYPGITELLEALSLKGVRLAIVTNKPEITAKQLASHFFPGKFLYVRGGRAGAVLKPDPEDTLEVIDAFGASLDKTAFIGDTSVDILTGKNAGVTSIGVSWGFRDKNELLRAEADFAVDTADELLRVLERI